ncbi:MAG: hypothetical protein KC917_23655, partial [Candidatus Omnitrophica bacterium]|nr:hypothetical protein [Candidatus Omnitrophota bacterium]
PWFQFEKPMLFASMFFNLCHSELIAVGLLIDTRERWSLYGIPAEAGIQSAGLPAGFPPSRE